MTPWTVACQAPLSMAFPRQEYWCGLPFPPPGHLPDPGIEPVSPALAGRFFPTKSPGKPSDTHILPWKGVWWLKKKKIVVIVPKLLSVIVVLFILINILSLASHLLFKMCCKLLRTWSTHTWVEVSISLTCQVHYNSLVNTRLPFFYSPQLKYSWFGLPRWH